MTGYGGSSGISGSSSGSSIRSSGMAVDGSSSGSGIRSSGCGSSSRDVHSNGRAPSQQAQHASLYGRHRQYGASLHNRRRCTAGGVQLPLSLAKVLMMALVVLIAAARGGLDLNLPCAAAEEATSKPQGVAESVKGGGVGVEAGTQLPPSLLGPWGGGQGSRRREAQGSGRRQQGEHQQQGRQVRQEVDGPQHQHQERQQEGQEVKQPHQHQQHVRQQHQQQQGRQQQQQARQQAHEGNDQQQGEQQQQQQKKQQEKQQVHEQQQRRRHLKQQRQQQRQRRVDCLVAPAKRQLGDYRCPSAPAATGSGDAGGRGGVGPGVGKVWTRELVEEVMAVRYGPVLYHHPLENYFLEVG